MESVATSHTGRLRLSPDDVVLFPRGLPGFQEHRRFRVTHPNGLAPLVYLQSLKAPYPRFILLPAELIDPDYRLRMEQWDHEILFPPSGFSQKLERRESASQESLSQGSVLQEDVRRNEPLTLYFVVSVAANCFATVNMLAPIVIRPQVLLGVQAVRADTRYSAAAPLQSTGGGIQ